MHSKIEETNQPNSFTVFRDSFINGSDFRNSHLKLKDFLTLYNKTTLDLGMRGLGFKQPIQLLSCAIVLVNSAQINHLLYESNLYIDFKICCCTKLLKLLQKQIMWRRPVQRVHSPRLQSQNPPSNPSRK